MDGKLNLFAAISKRMEWLGQRQNVLARNLANSDTPNYVPQDLDQAQFLRVLRSQTRSTGPRMTHARHMSGTAPHGGPGQAKDQKSTYETSPSGNAVILEEQLMKVAKTQGDHQLMTNLYRKHMDMFRTALRGGG